LWIVWRDAKQAWDDEEASRVVLLSLIHAPQSVVDAAERVLVAAEEKTMTAVTQLFQGYNLSLATHEGRARWTA
jgi:hypothetical protein